jgi:hypothetical protein
MLKAILPQLIEDDEKIVRSIFSPINLTKDLKTLRPNTFKPPADLDEISVNRLSYTTTHYCKLMSKSIENPLSDRKYFGLALLYASKIREHSAEIIYTPMGNNIFHADIKIGYCVIKGVQLPAEIQYKVNNLTKAAKLFIDPNPNSNDWEGIEVE